MSAARARGPRRVGTERSVLQAGRVEADGRGHPRVEGGPEREVSADAEARRVQDADVRAIGQDRPAPRPGRSRTARSSSRPRPARPAALPASSNSSATPARSRAGRSPARRRRTRTRPAAGRCAAWTRSAGRCRCTAARPATGRRRPGGSRSSGSRRPAPASAPRPPAASRRRRQYGPAQSRTESSSPGKRRPARPRRTDHGGERRARSEQAGLAQHLSVVERRLQRVRIDHLAGFATVCGPSRAMRREQLQAGGSLTRTAPADELDVVEDPGAGGHGS